MRNKQVVIILNICLGCSAQIWSPLRLVRVPGQQLLLRRRPSPASFQLLSQGNWDPPHSGPATWAKVIARENFLKLLGSRHLEKNKEITKTKRMIFILNKREIHEFQTFGPWDQSLPFVSFSALYSQTRASMLPSLWCQSHNVMVGCHLETSL